MKTMSKKIASIVLALCLCFSLVGTALAAGADDTGSITVNGSAGETYSIYQIFELTYAEDDDDNITSYSYKAVSDWVEFLTGYTATIGEEEVTLFILDGNGYLDPSSPIFDEEYGSSVMVDFAKDALAYATENEIQATASGIAVAEEGAEPDADTGVTPGSITFNDLALGWYLVSSSQGTLCMLDSTDPDAEVNEKNAAPIIEKYVEDITEKDADDDYTDSDYADVIDTLRYEIILRDVNSVHELCLHDVIDTDMILDAESITVYLNGTEEENQVDDANYKITTEGLTDGCCFEIEFDDDFLDTLTAEDQLYIIYTVTIDEETLESEEEGGFTGDVHDFHNVAHLTYGYAQVSPEAETDTYSYGFELYKYTTDDEDDEENRVALAGAEFVIKYVDVDVDEGTETTYYAQFDEEGEDPELQYILSGWTTDIEAATTLVTPEDGLIYVEGFDPEITYYIEETAAPDGYNMLTGDITVVINVDVNNSLLFSITYTYNGDSTTTGGGATGQHQIEILNNAGAELPGTGGIGTTIFYIIGGVLVVGAAVVLVTRRRMTRSEG